jgi:hypothetical protein
MNLIRFVDSDEDTVWINPMMVTHIYDSIGQAHDGAPLTTIYFNNRSYITVKGYGETIANRLMGSTEK